MLPEERKTTPLANLNQCSKRIIFSFFDVDEFEEIVEYYVEYGRISKAKRALEIGLSQHPDASSLKLLKC